MNNSSSKLFSATLIMVVVLFIICIFPSVSAFNFTDEGVVVNYNYDEQDITGTGTIIDSLNIFNATNNGGDNVTGKINTGYSMTAGNIDYICNADAGLRKPTATDWSSCAWIKSDDGTVRGDVMGESGVWKLYNGLTSDKWEFGYQGSGGIARALGTSNIQEGVWQLVCSTYDTDTKNLTIYVDGVNENYTILSGTESTSTNPFFVGTEVTGNCAGSTFNSFSGDVDEVSVFNKTLSHTEIQELYNSGNGLPFSLSISIVLETPANGNTISDVGTNFTASGDVTSSFNVTNVTFYIWDDDGDIHNQTTVILADSQKFNETLFIDEFVLGDYIWNAQVCWDNSTINNCTFANNNYTFNVVPTSVLSETFVNTTIEGSTDEFSINLSVLSGLRMATIDFVYNGNSYDADFIEYETEKYYASFTHGIPLVDTDSNYTFYWAITLESGFEQNSTMNNQTVRNLIFDNCGSYSNVIFNFTMVDEDSQLFLNGTTENTSILTDLVLSRLNSTVLPINFSSLYNQTNPAPICTNVNLNDSRFRIDGVVEYSASNRFVEFYNIKNYTLTNSTDEQLITLYNLNSSLGQEFKITYKDDNFNTVPGALIQIQRKYIDEGVFKTVEIPIIGEAGYTIAHLIRNDIIYNLVIIKDGSVIATFNNIVADCQNPTFTECSININSFSTGIQPEDFSNDGEFTGAISYNRTSRVVSTTYAIISGIPALTTLNVTLWDALGETSICSDSLTAAGGTLSCTVPESYGNSSIIIKLTSGGVLRRSAIINLSQDPADIYGNNLVFLGLMIILLIIGMSVTDNPMTLGIMLVVGSIMLVVLNIVTNTGWIGSGATLLWLIVSVVILLIKGSNRQ